MDIYLFLGECFCSMMRVSYDEMGLSYWIEVDELWREFWVYGNKKDFSEYGGEDEVKEGEIDKIMKDIVGEIYGNKVGS